MRLVERIMPRVRLNMLAFSGRRLPAATTMDIVVVAGCSLGFSGMVGVIVFGTLYLIIR